MKLVICSRQICQSAIYKFWKPESGYQFHIEENLSEIQEWRISPLNSNQILKGIHIEENLSKIRNPGMKDFSLISRYILKGIHIEENPSKNEKPRNEGFLFNF